MRRSRSPRDRLITPPSGRAARPHWTQRRREPQRIAERNGRSPGRHEPVVTLLRPGQRRSSSDVARQGPCPLDVLGALQPPPLAGVVVERQHAVRRGPASAAARRCSEPQSTGTGRAVRAEPAPDLLEGLTKTRQTICGGHRADNYHLADVCTIDCKLAMVVATRCAVRPSSCTVCPGRAGPAPPAPNRPAWPRAASSLMDCGRYW
jgi:hypothetical protein